MEGEFKDAFIFDYRYDLQLEACRVEWLRGMLLHVRDPAFYRDAVCAELNRLDDPLSWHADQLCALARHFTLDGDPLARAALEGVVERVGVGWEQLIQLDGATALPRVFSLWGRFDWWSWSVMDAAAAAVGRETAEAILKAEAQRSEPAARLLADFLAPETDRRPSVPMTLQEIEAEIEAGDDRRSIAFGGQASEEERQHLFQWLLREQRPDQIRCLLRVFRNQKTPTLADRLLELALSPYDHVRDDARRALGQWEDKRVHAFALRLLDRQIPDSFEKSVTELFVRNFQPADAGRIESLLPRSIDDATAYAIAGDIIDIATSDSTPELAGCLLWTYEHSPAACIRSWAVRELIRRNSLPQSVGEECRDDSYAETRALVGGF